MVRVTVLFVETTDVIVQFEISLATPEISHIGVSRTTIVPAGASLKSPL